MFLNGFKAFFRMFSIACFLFLIFENQANSHMVTTADGALIRLAHTQKEKADQSWFRLLDQCAGNYRSAQ